MNMNKILNLPYVLLVCLILSLPGCGGGGGSDNSGSTENTNSVPSAPTGVFAVEGKGKASLNWNTVTGATSYNIYYGTAAGVTTTTGNKIANAVSPQIISGLTDGATYYFVVTAVNGQGEGVASTEAIGTPAANKAIAGGFQHSIAVKADGSVWAWGYNWDGQLGDGTTTDRLTPVQVTGLSDVVAVASGMFYTMALKSDGTVWAWGNNGSGQLGLGTYDFNSHAIPAQIAGLTGVKAITAGAYHAVALKSDGTVWAWGENGFGNLGNGTTTIRISSPVKVSGLTDVTAVVSGRYHTLALKKDGTVWAWGRNDYGALGNGVSDPGTLNPSSNIPVQAIGLTGITAIAAGFNHSIALKSDGAVWVWGMNVYGELGIGTYDASFNSTPVQNGVAGVNSITGSHYSSFVLKSDGSVWSWGNNTYSQLGYDLATLQSAVPQQIPGVVASAVAKTHRETTLIIKTDDAVWAIGYNEKGQLGDGTTNHNIVGLAQVISMSGM